MVDAITRLREPQRDFSVSDNGLGLPIGFDPACSKGLGMKNVLSLVKQIGGELCFLPSDNGRSVRFTIRILRSQACDQWNLNSSAQIADASPPI